MASETVEMAQAGDYLGHPQRSYSLERGDLDEMVANFSGPRTVDYDHATQNPLIERATSAGMIQRVWTEGETLFAEIDWTDAAEQLIDAGEFNWLSPVIDDDATDKATGASLGWELKMAGLTNTPFMEGNASIGNAAGGLPGGGKLARTAPATPSGIMNSKFSHLTDDATDDSSSSQPDPDTMADDTERSNWERFKAKLSGILNSDSSDELDMLDDARQLSKAQDRAEQAETERDEAQSNLEEAQERIEELEGQVAEDEEQAEKEQAEADEELLNSAVENGKIKKAKRDFYAEQLSENPESTRAILNSMEAGRALPGGKPSAPDNPGDGEEPGSSAGSPAASSFIDYASGDD